MYRYAIVGSRNFNNWRFFRKSLRPFKDNMEMIISGGATGADDLAEKYAHKHNIPIKIFLPDWQKYGRAAGPKRNRLIVENSDIVIAFWDGKSPGTKSSIDIAKELNKHIHIISIKD